MDRSYPYSRRLTRRSQLQKRLAAVAALGVAGCAFVYALTAPSPAATPDSLPSAVAAVASTGVEAPAQTAQAGQRRIYPYSVVAGGVANARELGRVIREDKVVAAHYAEFDMSRAHEKTVATPRAVHVSYRKGDKVYWTAKKVMLHEGETLLSDGTHEARARCANQISDTPRLPVEAHGPSAEELDSSVVEDGMQNVSAGMLDGQGAPGGFLYAPGSGTSGGILGGGADTGSQFAAAASVPHAPRGAYRYSGSGSIGGDTGGSGSGGSGTGGTGAGGAGTGGSGDGGTGSTGGGTPGTSAPDSGTPGSGTPGSNTPDTPQTSPSQPSTPTVPPATPGNPSGGTNPGTPSTPSNAGLPQPSNPGGGQPGGGETGGGGNTVPTVPPTDGGANPSPGGNPGTGGDPAPGGTPSNPGIPEGGPDSSPVPGPTLGGDPQEPTKPVEEPAKPVDVPEPGSFWLVGAALGLMLLQRRFARRS